MLSTITIPLSLWKLRKRDMPSPMEIPLSLWKRVMVPTMMTSLALWEWDMAPPMRVTLCLWTRERPLPLEDLLRNQDRRHQARGNRKTAMVTIKIIVGHQSSHRNCTRL